MSTRTQGRLEGEPGDEAIRDDHASTGPDPGVTILSRRSRIRGRAAGLPSP